MPPPGGTATGEFVEGRRWRLWDTATGRQRLRLAGHTGAVRALAFTGDGRTLVSAAGDDTVRLWDPTTGKQRQLLKEDRPPRGHMVRFNLRALGLRPDGNSLVTWGDDQVLRPWDLATGKPSASRRVVLRGLADSQPDDPVELSAAVDRIRDAALLPDGATLLVASDKLIYLADVADGRQVFTFPSPPGLTCLDMAPDRQTR